MGKNTRPTDYDARGVADAHAHLESAVYGDQVQAVIQRAWDRGVRAIIAVAADKSPAIYEETRALANKHERIWATAGIHPHYAQYHQQLWEPMVAVLDDRRVVALGEFGLDYHYMNSPREVQRDVMCRQLEESLGRSMPIVLHIREAFQEALEILDSFAQTHDGVVHCFSGTPAEAQEFLSRGFYLSIPGIVTFPKAVDLHEAVRRCPPDRILLETDAPYLAPAPFRGRRNEPAYVAFTLEAVALLKNVPADRMAGITWENTRRVFRL